MQGFEIISKNIDVDEKPRDLMNTKTNRRIRQSDAVTSHLYFLKPELHNKSGTAKSYKSPSFTKHPSDRQHRNSEHIKAILSFRSRKICTDVYPSTGQGFSPLSAVIPDIKGPKPHGRHKTLVKRRVEGGGGCCCSAATYKRSLRNDAKR